MASIRDWLASAPAHPEGFLWTVGTGVSLGRLATHTSLAGRARDLADRSVLIATRDQYAAALALIELDGKARRLIVCPPDVPSAHLRAVVATAGVDAVVSDRDHFDEIPLHVHCDGSVTTLTSFEIHHSQFEIESEWVLLTSGTSGAPKMLVHSLTGLTAPFARPPEPGNDVVWGTFYDIRRYGGLQIFLRAVLGRASLALQGAGEPIGQYLARLGAHGVTHISGTPSHWRRALMSPEAHKISPRYIRLSGEIADQGILNALRAFFPKARISHAFASTEAGVGFEVNDGLEGFPASIVGAAGDVQIKIEDGTLRLRSTRRASRYLGEDKAAVAGDDEFVDTGDVVERRGDRYYFLGRRSGVINVGGLKVYPEEVEAAINRHPAVRMSMVRSARSPITGSLVAADVVLKGEIEPAAGATVDVRGEILRLCHASLAAYKIPATIRFVPALEIAAAGKLARHA
jgi:acyl-coenzyme A synthetase/AMP-(fatty) acid ligase